MLVLWSSYIPSPALRVFAVESQVLSRVLRFCPPGFPDTLPWFVLRLLALLEATMTDTLLLRLFETTNLPSAAGVKSSATPKALNLLLKARSLMASP